ncbi:MAG: metallophosphoesterase [Candidatus Delongbacteria bacterium]
MNNIKALIMFITTISLIFYIFSFITVMMLNILFERKISVKLNLLYSLIILAVFYIFMFTGRGFDIPFLFNLGFYLGVLIMYALLFAIILKLSGFIYNPGPKVNLILMISLIFACFSYGIYNAHGLKIKTVNLSSAKINKPYKFVQISDVHLGTESLDYLDTVVSEVNSLEPDLVFITGDLLDDHKLRPENVIGLADLSSPAYFITGNHERYSMYTDEFFEKCLTVTVLDHFRRQDDFNEDVTVFGIEWNRNNFANRRSEQIIFFDSIKVDDSKFNIFLNHEPALVEEAAQNGMDLMLSGHTHSGQIFPFNFFVRLRYKFIYGLYRIGNMDLYVTSGTGVWGPFMRVGSDNEIVEINLTPE